VVGKKSISTHKQQDDGCELDLRLSGLLRREIRGQGGRQDAPVPAEARSGGAAPGVDAALVFEDEMVQTEFKSGILEVSTVYGSHDTTIFSFVLKTSLIKQQFGLCACMINTRRNFPRTFVILLPNPSLDIAFPPYHQSFYAQVLHVSASGFLHVIWR